MAGPGPVHVVVLYVHPLLGEGLARLLAADPDIAATAISRDDDLAVSMCVALRPNVVVVEEGTIALAASLADADWRPRVLFLGGNVEEASGASVTRDPDSIVRAIRELKPRRMGFVTA